MTNMPFGAFRSDRMPRFDTTTKNAKLLSSHTTPQEAMDACNAARRADNASHQFTYWVADSQYPVEETITS